ncbi:regulatory protein RecX [Candidatus Peregrinibacteria bacterium]|nr:regulatory protein RecX [Candidatus Peregrinibacteria bacterium]
MTINRIDKDFYRRFLNYAFWLLGRRAYSKKEITQKFERKAKKIKLEENVSEPLIEKVLKRLTELNYINDAKILDSYFEYRLPARPAGKFVFLNEMKRRGIPMDEAKRVWDEKKIDEKILAEEFIAGKIKRFAGLDARIKKKRIAGLLARRGFEANIVWSVIEKL